MIKVGITGGIGSGKTTISNILRDNGYFVFDSDIIAKEILNSDKFIISKVKENFGDDIYENDVLMRSKLSNIVFGDINKLNILNSIVHSATRNKMNDDMVKHSEDDFFFVESAIMFEHGLNEKMNCVITITAPEEIRINRVILRDNTTKEKILTRIDKQMSESERRLKSDYIIDTDNPSDIIRYKILRVLKNIKKSYNK